MACGKVFLLHIFFSAGYNPPIYTAIIVTLCLKFVNLKYRNFVVGPKKRVWERCRLPQQEAAPGYDFVMAENAGEFLQLQHLLGQAAHHAGATGAESRGKSLRFPLQIFHGVIPLTGTAGFVGIGH